MGWFWGASSSGDDGDRSRDPLRDLDPGLRDFLKKESPVKYDSSNPPAKPQPTPIPEPTHTTPLPPTKPNSNNQNPSVPLESLFPDGRYAHLWKTYEPQAEAEGAAKSDQEKIADTIEGYKHRRAQIGRAALENCAIEQWDVNDCFRNGGWTSRLTMCRTENQTLSRCYDMQTRFLKALGYLSTYDRPQEINEQIQMHADTLYHRMLEQEKEIEAAKAEGRPVPTFPPLLSYRPKLAASLPSAVPRDGINTSDLSKKVQDGLKKRLDGLEGEERDLEERAINAEIAAGLEVAKTLDKLRDEQAEDRKKRKEAGTETIGDRVISIFGRHR